MRNEEDPPPAPDDVGGEGFWAGIGGGESPTAPGGTLAWAPSSFAVRRRRLCTPEVETEFDEMDLVVIISLYVKIGGGGWRSFYYSIGVWEIDLEGRREGAAAVDQ